MLWPREEAPRGPQGKGNSVDSSFPIKESVNVNLKVSNSSTRRKATHSSPQLSKILPPSRCVGVFSLHEAPAFRTRLRTCTRTLRSTIPYAATRTLRNREEKRSGVNLDRAYAVIRSYSTNCLCAQVMQCRAEHTSRKLSPPTD